MNEYVEVFAGERARVYDERIPVMIPVYSEIFRVLGAIRGRHPAGGSWLSVGCGSGQDFAEFANDESYQITGIDPSPQMLEQARQRFADRVRLYPVSLGELPTDADSEYDILTLVLVLHFLPDDGSKLELLREIRRRLRPGSSFLLFDFVQRPEIPDSLFSQYAAAYTQINESDLRIYRRRLRTGMHLITEERFGALAADAGFAAPVRLFQWLHLSGFLFSVE